MSADFPAHDVNTIASTLRLDITAAVMRVIVCKKMDGNVKLNDCKLLVKMTYIKNKLLELPVDFVR